MNIKNESEILFEKIKQINTNKDNFFLIAGPCVIEDKYILFDTAKFLKELCVKNNILLIFKSSYLKANRTSINSFTGIGIDAGLSLLNYIKTQFDLPIITDAHETIEIDKVSEIADIIQIPAFLSRQTELILKAAKTNKIINIKKGQFMSPYDMYHAANKVYDNHNDKIILTERGNSFGYNNLVVDFRNFKIMSEIGYPVVYDVTHSLQQPSLNEISGGEPKFALSLAKAAIATNYVDGLFIEVHPNPSKAKSDKNTMLNFEQTEELINCVKKLKCRM